MEKPPSPHASLATERITPPSPGRSRGGRPSRQAVVQLEQRILDVAAELFAKQGYAATSMEQVAETCQAGKDTIYRRYPSKGALFGAVMAHFRAPVLDELERCLSSPGSAQEQLRRYARALLEINLRPQLVALNRVALAEALPAKGVQMPTGENDPILQQLTQLVAQAQASGDLIEADTAFMAEQLLYATAIRPLVSTMLGQSAFADTTSQQRYFDQAWHLFMRGAGQSFED